MIEDTGIVDWRHSKHSGMLFAVHEDLWDNIAADQSVLPLTTDQKAELHRRLDAYAIDADRGQIATDAILNIRRRL